MILNLTIKNEEQLMQVTKHLVDAYKRLQLKGLVIYLEGVLGAGKTTFVRGVMRALGYKDAVKSPTYTLVESYECGGEKVQHWDFYRIEDPEELEFIGVSEYFTLETISLIEWPKQGGKLIPSPDLTFVIELEGSARRVSIQAHSIKAEKILQSIADSSS